MEQLELAKEILTKSETIAVVGLSPREDSPSHYVAKYLIKQGYRVFPVNPKYSTVLGIQGSATLTSLAKSVKVDVVNIFRHPADIPPIVEEAIKIQAPYVWMQEGIVNHQAKEMAERNGIQVVMDRCMMKSHKSLIKE